MKPKPKIRLSRIARAFICSGLGCTGSGESFRSAWECWAEQMVKTGRSKLIPHERK